MLSMILTLAVLFPDITETQIVGILIGGSALAIVVAIGVRLAEPTPVPVDALRDGALIEQFERDRVTWRMRPLGELPPARLTTLNRVWLIVLRGYLIVAAGLVLVRIVQLAIVGA